MEYNCNKICDFVPVLKEKITFATKKTKKSAEKCYRRAKKSVIIGCNGEIRGFEYSY
jgi:hypothetical protein